jgi:hypothetical protein
MNRTRIVGLCLLAAFAISMVAMASSASAGEYFWCQKVGKKKGKYSESKCATLAEKKGKPAGEWEKVSVTPCVNVGKKKGFYADNKCTVKSEKKGKPKGEFELVCGPKPPRTQATNECAYTSTGGPASLSTPLLGPGKVKCLTNTDEGEITGNFTDTDRVTFRNCTFEGLPCQSGGPNGTEPAGTPAEKEGVIETNLLDSRLIDFPETVVIHNPETTAPETVGPAEGHVWEELKSSEHEPYSTEFGCGGIVFLRTAGYDAGEYNVADLGKLSKTQHVKFEAGVGAGSGGLLTEALTESGWVPPGGVPSIEEAGTATITNTSEIEVRA